MTDPAVISALQAAARQLQMQFPGRAFSLFVWPENLDERAHYIANAPRSMVLAAMTELIAKGGPQLPESPREN